MAAFFESFVNKRGRVENFVAPHLGYLIKRLGDIDDNSLVFGERFTSLQNGFERTAGIITGSLFCLLEIPLRLLSIFIRTFDGLYELAKDNYSMVGMQVSGIGSELKDILFFSIVAVASLFVNLADVVVGIGNTLIDATTTAPRMS